MQTLPAPLRALVFDLDGTLADTFNHLADCFATALEPNLGRRVRPEEVFSRFGLWAGPEISILADLAGGHYPEVVEAFYQVYQERHPRAVRLFPGIAEVIDAAQKRGLRLGLLTGKGRRATEITLEQLGIRQHFTTLMTGDDAPFPKPHPDGLLLVLRALEAETSEALFVGDSRADVGAGRAAGVFTAWAGWNRAFAETLTDDMAPDHVLAEPADLLRLLTSAVGEARNGNTHHG